MRSMILPLATAVVAWSGLAASAMAQETWPNWYVGLNGALNYVPDADIGGAVSGESEQELGYAWGVALGYAPHTSMDFFKNTHMELEFRKHNSGIDQFVSGGIPVAASGDIETEAYMANFLYDFNNTSKFVPYLGGGLGLANIEIEDINTLGVTGSEDDTVFAWQLMAGLGYRPAGMPSTEWTLGYRYFDTQDPEFSTAGGAIDADVQQHMLEAGAKLRF